MMPIEPISVRALARVALLGWALTLGQSALAQADAPTLLKDGDLTEANLLRALSPATPASPSAAAAAAATEPAAVSPADNGDVDVNVGTRSLQVSAAKAAAPKKRPSASLLITFETNSAALTARAREQLDVVAAALKNDRLREFSFLVEGHADARGNADANMTLSMERAESVRSYLVGSQNVPEAKLRAVGRGDTEPLNAKDPAAPENRRVTIVTQAQ